MLAMGAIRDEDFLALWREHGMKLPWRGYAQRLSVMTGQDISEAYVRVWVARNRERLEAKFGENIGPRRVSVADAYSAWGPLPAELRARSLYHVLECHERQKALGLDSLSKPNRDLYLRVRRELIEANEIIRYDIGLGLYRDRRTSKEAAADPDYERLSETREAYEGRRRGTHRR